MARLIEYKRLEQEQITDYSPRKTRMQGVYNSYYVCSNCGFEQKPSSNFCKCCNITFNGMTSEEEQEWREQSKILGTKFLNFEIPYDALKRALWMGELKNFCEEK